MQSRTWLSLSSLLWLAGCASSSIRSDIAQVQELAKVDGLDRLFAPERRADAPSEEVRRLLRSPLDAETAVRIALLNNRQLRAKLRAMGVARGAYVQAGLPPNPVVEAELLPERDTQLELRVESGTGRSRGLVQPPRGHGRRPRRPGAHARRRHPRA